MKKRITPFYYHYLYRVPKALVKFIVNYNKYVGNKRKNSFYLNDVKENLVEQKSTIKIITDHLKSIIKYGDPIDYYYRYGLDIKVKKASEYIPVYYHVKINEWFHTHTNGEKSYNYLCLLQDKWIFSQVMEAIGAPVPETKGYILNDKILYKHSAGEASFITFDELAKLKVNVMLKPSDSLCGMGIVHLVCNDGKMMLNGKEINSAELKSKLSSHDVYIIQEYIDNQHKALKKLYPKAVNTMRVVTLRKKDGEVIVLNQTFLIGCNAEIVSNGDDCVVINVDKDGKLYKYGSSVTYKRIERHPNTGVVFENYQIPFFNEAIDVVKKTHSQMYGLYAIGWDVAITEDGPLIIEGNDNWGLPSQQAASERGWKPIYDKYFNIDDISV